MLVMALHIGSVHLQKLGNYIYLQRVKVFNLKPATAGFKKFTSGSEYNSQYPQSQPNQAVWLSSLTILLLFLRFLAQDHE